MLWKIKLSLSHRIHGTGIFSYMYHEFMVNVGQYTKHGSYGFGPWPIFRDKLQVVLGYFDPGNSIKSSMLTMLHVGYFYAICNMQDTTKFTKKSTIFFCVGYMIYVYDKFGTTYSISYELRTPQFEMGSIFCQRSETNSCDSQGFD